MKTQIALFFVMIMAAPMARASVDSFLGRYRVSVETCPAFASVSSERAYVTQATDSYGHPVIRIEAFGEDAQMADILLGSGVRKTPGTSDEFHGKVTDTWETTWTLNGMAMETVVTTKRVDEKNPRFNLEYTYSMRLAKTGGTLFFGEISEEESTYCELSPWN